MNRLYKETVIKFNWNVTAKLLQEKFFTEFNLKIEPFSDLEFKSARQARDAKRKELQVNIEKRKKSSVAFTPLEHNQLQKDWSENTPEGLQKKFYFTAAKELAWRGNEGANAKLHYFQFEQDNFGNPTERIEYNPIFGKMRQGGSKSCAESKWLVSNTINQNLCPVRLFKKLIQKRPKHVTWDRLFLTQNPNWNSTDGVEWYKNSPVGTNTISKWTQETAKLIGLDTVTKKFTNHSHRSTAVTHLAQSGICEQELMKITGHTSSNSLRPYLQIQPKSHEEILTAIRTNCSTTNTTLSQFVTMDATTEMPASAISASAMSTSNMLASTKNTVSDLKSTFSPLYFSYSEFPLLI
jgi:hypothetical protein